MTSALLQLRGVRRDYRWAGGVSTALRDIDLEVQLGEYIAITGTSGSGKSTLMNILGCLDRPTAGVYCIAGRATTTMTPGELAELRRDRFGFVFQRYNLLSDLSAVDNVALPATYAGMYRQHRRARAVALLSRLQLADRLYHRPGQLSGGQQQRVSIARALMNGGEIILADEPTGALDSHSGGEVLAILQELHSLGHTVIVVTHDYKVARHAQRIIELNDGRIVGDRNSPSQRAKSLDRQQPVTSQPRETTGTFGGFWPRLREALGIALLTVNAHRMRSCLTMLGIVAGIASVIGVVALGNGTENEVLRSIGSLGTNTLDIYPGTEYGDIRAGRVQTLRATDALMLASLWFVDSATPAVSTSAIIRYGSFAMDAQVYGIGGQFFRVMGMRIVDGAAFNTRAVDRMDQSVVIDQNARQQLFGDTGDSPIGKIILLGRVPARVVGVVEGSESFFGGANLSVWLPYTTMMTRMLGQAHVSRITVRIADSFPMQSAQAAISTLLSIQHGRTDFFIQNTAHIREAIEDTTTSMTWLICSIAAVSLFVGGIGVMNIMLISVTERTREIGVRIAVGARPSDILQQFLVEAIVICLIGGTVGVLLALAIGVIANHLGRGHFPMIFSANSIVAGVVCSTLVGVAFGILPARNAARLDPIAALSRE